MRIGCHLSIAKGLATSLELAREVKANCFQFFTRNPRGGAARRIEASEIASWEGLRAQADIFPIVGHLPYTINLAAGKDDTYEFARQTVAEDLARMSAIGAEYLVVHPGSRGTQSVGEGVRRIVRALDDILARHKPTSETKLLLETMSGSGSEIGSFAEIGLILSELGYPEALGVCIDTCHLFAMGYDWREAREVGRMLEDAERHVGLARIKCVHVNDSKFGPGSHKDRHELVGEGQIGQAGFVNILGHERIKRLPMLLETPVADYSGYAQEIAKLRLWLTE
jgi:deoxyribonuclease-4